MFLDPSLFVSAKIPASQLREPETGREEGGGDTGEEGTHQEVAGKRNYGSLTPCGYTRTSLSMFPAKLTLA